MSITEQLKLLKLKKNDVYSNLVNVRMLIRNNELEAASKYLEKAISELYNMDI